MSKVKGKEKFGHDIDPVIIAQFNEIAVRLRYRKYDVLEAAISAFDALPDHVKRVLIAAGPEEREPALQALAAVGLPPAGPRESATG